MKTLFCDVVGCQQPAVWKRIGTASPSHEDALCLKCWANLQSACPDEALCYTLTDTELTLSFREGDSKFMQPAEQIVIA